MDRATDADRVADALTAIPSDDRETWVRVGMSIKAALGDAGRALFMTWSAKSPKFNERVALQQWRSFRPTKIGPGTLFSVAADHGWRADDSYVNPPPRKQVSREEQARWERTREEQARRAAAEARRALSRATMAEHPYLEAKGFSGRLGPVLGDVLAVPMHRWPNRKEIVGYQAIWPSGKKLFQPRGMSSFKAVHLIGGHMARKGKRWWVEGYATGISVYLALQKIYRPDDLVIVAFSAGNMARLARTGRTGFVIADHDWRVCREDKTHRWDHPGPCPHCGAGGIEPAGQKARDNAKLPSWMPPAPGTDADDFRRSHGIDALADALRDLVMEA